MLAPWAPRILRETSLATPGLRDTMNSINNAMETQHNIERPDDNMARPPSPTSRSSSLSPPPSSPLDELPIPSPPQSPSPERHDISLDSITISSPKSTIGLPDMAPVTRSASRKLVAQIDPQEPHEVEQEKDTRDTTSMSKPKSSGKGIIKKITNKVPRQKWTPERLLADPKSPVARADIRSLLCNNPPAWDILTPQEKTEILALFPSGTPIINAGTPDARPDMALLASDDNFRHDCARYAENLAEGKHDPQWLAEAWAASEQRRVGEFEKYLEEKFEEEWGVKLPDHMRRSTDRPATSQAGSQDSAPSSHPGSQNADNAPDDRNDAGDAGRGEVNGDCESGGSYAARSPAAEGASPAKKQRIS
ncbi:hypothetical protein SODALDRAFT_152445 [Sodiomyces alkalinus F11]|uniref:DEUBAD domain-containing protein n=1 Tax=Sodiomyces alkalinus (strain CBS 110278 / VKM F-3762 / F11) TaxID=1314773 RepID=A0A3N2PXA1_SODAK|nr:hypothetical protein SODALDRAFT_152445 [Sodiomyces alkalinus F11]ROT39117.1 hypothetical protein SODALDRAFT_152445 [Sodiomyces alkalinus F11]